MNKKVLLLLLVIYWLAPLHTKARTFEKDFNSKSNRNSLYTTSRAPLKENFYLELPLGAIKPESWLRTNWSGWQPV